MKKNSKAETWNYFSVSWQARLKRISTSLIQDRVRKTLRSEKKLAFRSPGCQFTSVRINDPFDPCLRRWPRWTLSVCQSGKTHLVFNSLMPVDVLSSWARNFILLKKGKTTFPSLKKLHKKRNYRYIKKMKIRIHIYLLMRIKKDMNPSINFTDVTAIY